MDGLVDFVNDDEEFLEKFLAEYKPEENLGSGSFS